MSRYRVAVNLEWTSKCNARCTMCPRSMIENAQLMSEETAARAAARIRPEDAFRCVVAGYGEPTTHPRFRHLVEGLRGHPVSFDMATNGSRLTAAHLECLDGVIDTLMISFSSVDPAVYAAVHANLDQQVVMDNIVRARDTLKKTKILINLSPTAECLATLDRTVAWFREQGIGELHMSPTYYDRAGAMETDAGPSHQVLRAKIRQYGFKSQEQAFIPSPREIAAQWWSNRFKCVPRNTNVLIGATGHYNFCFNDIRHSRAIGHVADMSLREAIEAREKSEAMAGICDRCNLRDRYRPRELARVAVDYARTRLAAA